MDRLETLEKKVQQAAEQLTTLREERQKLLSEIQFLKEENSRTQQLIRKNDTWQDEKKSVSHRIEKILKKINSLKI
jgi:hypothetical protein